MEKQKAKELAQQLIDSEFNEVNNNPLGYCEAMGWTKGSNGANLAIKHKDKINFTSVDVHNLASIIENLSTDDSIEIAENNAVSDFLTNCVAKNILELRPHLDVNGKEIEIGDQVAYATVYKYKPVLKLAKVTKIHAQFIQMQKFSCYRSETEKKVLIIKKAK